MKATGWDCCHQIERYQFRGFAVIQNIENGDLGQNHGDDIWGNNYDIDLF